MPDSPDNLQWIRESLERIEGRLNREEDSRDAKCKEESSRLSSLENWRSKVNGIMVVLMTETTIVLALLGIAASKGHL